MVYHKARCPDCDVDESEEHRPLCDQELCPICLEQLLSCAHHARMDRVQRKGRIPFVWFPLLCAKCGAQEPTFFAVPTKAWRTVVPRSHWDAILCRPCYDYLASL